jgi:hypothetical protein
MPDVDVKKLLDPTGPEAQAIVHGTRIQGRVAVTVYWAEIENALRSGLSITAIYRLLHKAGKVSVTLQAFTRQVKARREGTRAARAPAKPATEPRPSVESAVSADAAKPDTPAQTATDKPKLPEIKPGIPHRPWRTGPYQPPDPNAVFKPRDPLADD